MKITRRQLDQIIKETIGRSILSEQQSLSIQEIGDLVPKNGIQKMIAKLLEDAYGKKLRMDFSGDRDDRDGTAIPGKISSFGENAGKYSFDITYSFDMKSPEKVDRIWNNKVRGRAGYRGYSYDNEELDNRQNKIFKMSLVKRPYVAESEFVELVVRITMNDEYIKQLGKSS